MREVYMRTTITLDEDLLKEAEELTGITERSKLIHNGLEALIQREAAQRLARLGGSAPDIQPITHRTFQPVQSHRWDQPTLSPDDLVPNAPPSIR